MTMPGSNPTTFCPIWNGTQFFDNSGEPLKGGQLFTFYAGSHSNMAPTYANSSGITLNPNPMILDSSGRITTGIWLRTGTSYQLVIADQFGNDLQLVNNVGGGGV